MTFLHLYTHFPITYKAKCPLTQVSKGRQESKKAEKADKATPVQASFTSGKDQHYWIFKATDISETSVKQELNSHCIARDSDSPEQSTQVIFKQSIFCAQEVGFFSETLSVLC